MREGRPSTTAELIALSTVFLANHPRDGRLVPREAAALAGRFLEGTAPARLTLFRTLSKWPLRGLVLGLEALVLPGIQRHYAARKRYIESAARAFMGSGGRQLVVVGAGLDTLAWRLARAEPEARCVEIDHAATQAHKRRTAEATRPANLHFLAADLALRTLDATLDENPVLDRGRSAFVVVEGVTMYLSESAVRATLAACASFAAGTRIAWTFMRPDPRGRLRFRSAGGGVIDAWLARKGEPFTWGIHPEQVADLLAPLGLRVLEIAGPSLLAERFLRPLGIRAPLAEGECICLCEKPA